jgi:rRNA maturation endonuclease Nob1
MARLLSSEATSEKIASTTPIGTCVKCGEEFPEDARFCPNCGETFGEPAEEKKS